MKKQIWLPLKGYESLYLVSSFGVIASVDKKVGSGRGYIQKKKIMKSRMIRGYPSVTISKNNIPKIIKIHRAVAETFIDNPLNKDQVNHINGIKTDNNVSNLEWCTASENVKHAFRIGLKYQYVGGDHHNSVRINQFDKNGIFIKEWDSISSAARVIGTSVQNIHSCLSNKTLTSKGFIWRYV